MKGPESYKRVFTLKTLLYFDGRRKFDKYKLVVVDVLTSLVIVISILSLVFYEVATM